MTGQINSTSRVLVTGATGFIGRRLVSALLEQGAPVAVLVRDRGRTPAEWLRSIDVRQADLLVGASISKVCEGIDTVFHLASVAETSRERMHDGSDVHWRLTVDGTRSLLEEARRADVQRFIYASSVKAMGELTDGCIDETAEPRPVSRYGRAKLTAERLISETDAQHGISTSILRLPLVYGPDPRNNLIRMIAAIDRGRFPPLPNVRNKRSMVHVDDVVRALISVARNSAARAQTYLLTDGRAYSTREIYEAMCRMLGRTVPNWAVPTAMLRAASVLGDAIGAVTGRGFPINSAVLEKLLGSAWYSSDKIRRELGFEPAKTLESALPEMVAAYRAHLRGGEPNAKQMERAPDSIHR